MGLGIAENAALSGLRANKKAFDVLAQNIANVENEDYNSKQLKFANDILAGTGVGVKIEKVLRNVDQFLQAAVVSNTSLQSEAKVINDYNDRIQILLGKPGDSGTLSYAMDDFFASLKILSTNPDVRNQTVQKAAALAQKIYDIANGLQKIRYDADQDFYLGITDMNAKLSDLQGVQSILSQVTNAKGDNTALLDVRDSLISNIASYLDIKTYVDQSENASINTAGGIAIYSGYPYYMEYVPVSGPDVFVNNLAINDLTIYPSQTNLTNGIKLITGGEDGEVTSKLNSGKLQGLHYIRDVEIPRIIDQLDNLTAMIRDEFNAIHNDGSGVPPSNEFLGTTVVNTSEFHSFYGKARMAVLDSNGKPAKRPDGTDLNPLLLDLGGLDSGQGAGTPDVQTIIDEINQYFYYDPLMTKLELGNLEDVRLASLTDNMTANGIFDFNFELVNNSILQSDFQVNAITVYDNTTAVVAGAVTTTLPVTLKTYPGDRVRTSEITADFSGGAGGPYIIEATVIVTDEDGAVSSSILRFTIDDTPSGGANIMNDRYVATSIVSGAASFVPPSSTQRYLRADVVNATGTPVTGQPGYLSMIAENSTYGIAFSELDSEELGYTYSNGFRVPASNRGFSHFFGINNLFIDTGQEKGSASQLKVRSDIVTNPNRLSTAQLYPSASYITSQIVGDQQAYSDLQFTANPGIGSTITLNGVTFTYVAVAGANNQITIGASLADTMANTSSVLNATNTTTSGTVDLADYISNSVDTITIRHNAPGSGGNSFTFSYNLLGGAAISVDGGTSVVSANGNLSGGTDKSTNITVSPNSYEVSIGASQAVQNMFNLSVKTIQFDAAGTLPIMSTTFNGYAASIVNFAASEAKTSESNFEKQTVLFDAFFQKFREGSGVNLDQEMGYTIIYQNAYIASATIFSTVNKLFDVLFSKLT